MFQTEVRIKARVPAVNIEALSRALFRLNERTSARSIPAIYMDVGFRSSIQMPENAAADPRDHQPMVQREVAEIDIKTPAPVVAGYRVIARTVRMEKLVITHLVPGEALGEAHRRGVNKCDHCGRRFARADMFVMRRHDGVEHAIAFRCAPEVLHIENGYDLALWIETLHMAQVLAREFERPTIATEEPRWFQVEPFLSAVACAVRRFGWTSRAQAREDGDVTATSEEAAAILAGARMVDTNEGESRPVKPSMEDEAQARDAITWARAIEPENVEGFMASAHQIAGLDFIPVTLAGTAAAIVPSYLRQLKFDALQRKKARTSQKVGEIGERVSVTVKVTKVITGEPRSYGRSSTTSHLHLLEDGDGNIFKWQSTAGRLLEGKTYVIEGRVKKHEKFREVNQTVLSHCKTVEAEAETSS